jgi:hypothetical protein
MMEFKVGVQASFQVSPPDVSFITKAYVRPGRSTTGLMAAHLKELASDGDVAKMVP